MYVGALESKETAVTLPAVVLLYEVVWQPAAAWPPARLIRWARNQALPGLLAGLLTCVYLLGKVVGPDPVIFHNPAYTPLFTWTRYMESTVRFFDTVFFVQVFHHFFTPGKVLIVWALLLGAALWRRDRRLLWMWLFTVVAPLPICFVPGRNGICLSIPLVAWAVSGAILFVWLCDAVAQTRLLARVPIPVTRGALILLALGVLLRLTVRLDRINAPGMRHEGDLTWSVIEQVRTVQPTVPHGSRILFVNDVFPMWDTKFIAELTYHDRSVNVWLQHETPLTPAEAARMDYVFKFESGKLVRLPRGGAFH